MSTYVTLREEILASPDRVFDVLCDLDRIERWAPDLVRVEKLTDGSFGPGTRWRETRRASGREFSEEFEVATLEVNRAIEVLLDVTGEAARRGRYRFRYELEPTGGRTRVTVRGEIDGGGGVLETLARLFTGAMRRSITDDLRAMKRYIES